MNRTDLLEINQLNLNTIMEQNSRLSEQIKTINQLRQKNEALGDLAWEYYLAMICFRGLLGGEYGTRKSSM